MPRSRGALIFFFSQGAYGLATSIFDLVYALHLLDLGISESRVGSIFLVGFLAMAAVVVPLGMLADRLGQGTGMWTSSLGFGLSMLAIPFVQSYGGQLAAFTSASVFSAIMLASATAVMARLTPDERERLAVFRWGFVVFLLFSALGALAGGWLADLFPGGNTQYQVTLVVAGVVGVVIGLSRLVLVAVEEVPDPPDEHADVEVGAIRRFAGRAVAILLLASFVGGFSVLGIRYVNVILGDHFGVSVVSIGYVVTVDRLVSIAVVFMLIPLVRRTNEVVAAALFMVAILPLQVVAGLASSALLFAIPYLATRGLYYSQAPILDLVTNRHAPDRHKTLMNSVQRLGFFAGSGIAAQAYGALLGAGRFEETMLVAGVLAALAAGVYVVAFSGAPEPEPAVRLRAEESRGA